MATILSKTKNKKSKRVGRGGTRGKTSGRGTKGQKARAGHRIRPHIRDTIKKLPKLRGRGKNSNKVFRTKAAVVNLSAINTAFESGASISPSTLFSKGLIPRTKGVLPAVKILSNGEITKSFLFHDCQISETAKKKIIAASGTVN